MGEMKCPKCGSEFQEGVKVCLDCGTTLVEKPPVPKPTEKSCPGTLWLLPIFFGFIGGTIAALIADMKYHASWWEFFVAGILMSGVAYFLIFGMLVC